VLVTSFRQQAANVRQQQICETDPLVGRKPLTTLFDVYEGRSAQAQKRSEMILSEAEFLSPTFDALSEQNVKLLFSA
jgi:hypothetical protein